MRGEINVIVNHREQGVKWLWSTPRCYYSSHHRFLFTLHELQQSEIKGHNGNDEPERRRDKMVVASFKRYSGIHQNKPD